MTQGVEKIRRNSRLVIPLRRLAVHPSIDPYSSLPGLILIDRDEIEHFLGLCSVCSHALHWGSPKDEWI